MHLEDEDAAELKRWIVEKLEHISDADSDVLADYVLALIRAEAPESDLRETAAESLEDFLKDNTTTFLTEVFHAIHTRSYVPGHVLPAAVPTSPHSFTGPLVSANAYGSLGAHPNPFGGFQESRKRSFNDIQENGNLNDSQVARAVRPMKQSRRGGRGNGLDGLGIRGGRGGFQESATSFLNARSLPTPSSFPDMLMPPPGFSFDPSDPMGAFMAMQALGLPPLPGMLSLSNTGTPNGHTQFMTPTASMPTRRKRSERCQDYDTQGYCVKGDSCPHEHSTDRLIVPGEEYDPKNSALFGMQPTSPTSNGHAPSGDFRIDVSKRGQGRGRGDRTASLQRRQNNRAAFSAAGPNYDRSITTIVVEQIPEEKFDEMSVREFFTEFGNIDEVTMQPYKRLALIKFDRYGAARSAYESPKVIFDNRFVKVYWYKPGTLSTPPSPVKYTAAPSPDEPPFDKDKFERIAAAAQKKLEDKKAQMKDMETRRHALEKQKAELAKKQAEEKQKLLERLKARGISAVNVMDTETSMHGTNGVDDGKVSAHTKALREKVAELEAEAKSLGLDSALSDHIPQGRGRGRGRGSYRGGENLAGRRAGYESFRARGRGNFGTRGGGKYNLDNRTKRVEISGVEFNVERDEALRQYLVGVGEFEAIEMHPEKSDTQIITFKDRPTAEGFMYGTRDIPSVGKLEFSWYNAATLLGPTTAKPTGPDGDVGMAGAGANGNNSDHSAAVPTEMDYDVAEEDDRWK